MKRRTAIPCIDQAVVIDMLHNMDISIRKAIESDFMSIVELNEIEVKKTSPMDLDHLRVLDDFSSFHTVAEVEGGIVAFLLTMRENCAYDSENYRWFSTRFPKYLYVDRIVVDPAYAGLKIGSMLYQKAFEYARSSHIPFIVCEYNLIPPNERSRIFHAKFGFKEVGTQFLAGGTKKVSMQVAEV